MEAVYKKYLVTIAMIWGACVVGFVCGYMMVIAPALETKVKVEAELLEKQGIRDTANDTTSAIAKKRLKDELAKLQATLGDYAVSYENAAGLTFDISKIVTDKGIVGFKIISLSKDSFAPIQNCKSIGENMFKIGFEGSFQQFAYFLNRLERHTPVIFIDEFSIEAQHSDKENKTVSMAVSVFVLKPKDG